MCRDVLIEPTVKGEAISACDRVFCARKADARCEYSFKTADVYCADLFI